jgi:hypothetical protein
MIRRNALPITDTPRTDGPMPATGVFGVAIATSHEQFVFSVQLAFRQELSIQTNPFEQSAFTVHPLLQSDNTGVGVFPA